MSIVEIGFEDNFDLSIPPFETAFELSKAAAISKISILEIEVL